MRNFLKNMMIFLLVLSLIGTMAGCGSNNASENMPEHMPDNTEKSDNGGLFGGSTKVDPFENVIFDLYGKYGEGRISSYGWVLIYVNGEREEHFITVEVPENDGSLKNGDKVHVSLDESVGAYFEEKYGIKLTRMEADVEINGLVGDPNYVPGEPGVVDLSNYVSFYESGVSGSGSLQINIDYESMLEDYWAYFRLDSTDEDRLNYGTPYLGGKEIVKKFPVCTITCGEVACYTGNTYTDIYDILSNGDILNLKWEENAEGIAALQKVLNVTFDNSDLTYTMENLEPMKEVDPFEILDYTIEGKNGEGYIEGNVIIGSSGFHFDVISGNNGSLSNGDTVTISVESSKEIMAYVAGAIPTRTEYEITVSGLE